MRALLQPVIARELGVVLLKPGSELMSLFGGGRVLIERQPDSMAHLETGRVPDARQPLGDDKSLRTFFLNDKVIHAAGGISGLDYWLLRYAGGRCQYEHSDYHYLKWFTEFGHLNRGDMLTSEQHRCHNEKKKFQRRV
ncbi:hypothetical protein LGS00_12875 [Enterobacter hormaechei]|uniref:hypothetical protein n=1 Tax=Enterobacter hormaechei TaxID=158836 RepID=UPI001F3F252F|nr:hypothetical protein [Enterobacter hormaechei]MCF2293056.1 hypothetical protein [Enterobacter hormaechei]